MHLTLHLTTNCNMRCSYCYAQPHAGQAMSIDVARKALHLGARMTDGPCGVILFGGEPLLCKPLIAEIVDYARWMEREKRGRFLFKMTTNGALLDPAFLEYSVRNDILIAMSFDGVREAQDRHCRFADGRPTFDQLIPRLRMLLEVRPYASVLMTVNPDTVHHLVESVEFLMNINTRYIILSLNYAAPWEERDFKRLAKQMKILGGKYVEWTEQGRKFYLSPFDVKISSHVNKHCYQKERCELAARQISIDPAGYLYPCVQFTKAGPQSEWCIGSVDAGIDEHRRTLLRLQSDAEKKFCIDCAVKERCNNSCGCLNWQTTGSINEVSPVLCRYEQMMMPIADRVAEKLYKSREPHFLHKHYNDAYPALSLIEDGLTVDS